jgi:predicted deacylase
MAAVDNLNKTKTNLNKKVEKPQDIKKTVDPPAAPKVTVNNPDGNAILMTGATHARELLSM